jgi:glycerol kinase
LLSRLSGGRVHATDVSNASRTALYNLAAMEWDDELLERMQIPRQILPEVVDSAGVLAMTEPTWLGRPIPIASVIGDQQAALFGQNCHLAGMAKCTIGTGAFILAQTGASLPTSAESLIRTVAWRLPGQPPSYALEGAVFTAGTLINWLRDGLKAIDRAEETEVLARSVENTGGVAVVPAFSGLGSPYWDPTARGLMIGITSATTRAHVIRAALESIAFQIADVVRAMEDVSHRPLHQLRVDGGVARNSFVVQFLADVLGIAVERPRMPEATARGAALLAGMAIGMWESVDQLPPVDPDAVDRFLPQAENHGHRKEYARWQQAVERARGWAVGDTEAE